jgi:hypothetical protein
VKAAQERIAKREGGVIIPTHGDRVRLALAQTPEALATFAREALASILVLGDDVEAALRETLGT